MRPCYSELSSVRRRTDRIADSFNSRPNWITYRATVELMRRHGFMNAVHDPAYDDPATRCELLATFIMQTMAEQSSPVIHR